MNKNNTRGAIAIGYAVAIALSALFGYLAIPRVAADYRQRHAVKQVTAAAADAKKADDEHHAAEKDAGRVIQQQTAQASAAVGLLPASAQRDFIADRLSNVRLFSNQLYGQPTDAEVAQWQKVALDALSETAAVRVQAAKQIAVEQETNRATIARLDAAEQAKAVADARSARAVEQLQSTQRDLDHANGLVAFFKFVAKIAVVVLILAAVLGGLASHFPALAPIATGIHAVFAPGAALLLTKAKAETRDLLAKTGEFFGHVRAELPAIATKVRDIGNRVFDSAHKDVIGEIANQVHADKLATVAEAHATIAANGSAVAAVPSAPTT